MSRIGKQKINVKDGIQISIEDGGRFHHQLVKVKGPKGELQEDIRRGVKVTYNKESKEISLEVEKDTKQNKSLHGLYRSLIDNMCVGVVEGYSKYLELHGVGYRVKLNGKNLELNLGLNHPIIFEVVDGIEFEVIKDVDILVKGISKQLVGEVAAKIRRLRKPEPYKGKGIRYKGEYVRRKAGKTAVK